MHYSSITPKNRIGGREATRQAPLPVVMGLGDDFINFDDELTEELDAEKLEENKEMTEQEIESLESILNEKELLVVPIDEAADHLKDADPLE